MLPEANRCLGAVLIACAMIGSACIDTDGLEGTAGSAEADASHNADRDGAPDGSGPDGPQVPEVTPPYAIAVLADAPRIYLRLDDAPGAPLKNERGGAPLILPTGCMLGVTARVGRGLALDGVACRVALGHPFTAAGQVSYSIELWVQPSVVDVDVRWLAHYGSHTTTMTSGFELFFNNTTVEARRSSANLIDSAAVGPTLPTRGFTHVVMTYDGTDVRQYQNGVLSQATGSNVAIVDAGDTELVIGDRVPGIESKFKGIFDEIAVYDTVLTAPRVKAHFDAAK